MIVFLECKIKNQVNFPMNRREMESIVIAKSMEHCPKSFRIICMSKNG